MSARSAGRYRSQARAEAAAREQLAQVVPGAGEQPLAAGAGQAAQQQSLPEGLQVLHLCDHPWWCVRPTHLVLGSPAANVADRLRKQWVRASSRSRLPELPQHDAYRAAVRVRARHRQAGQQLALF